MWGFAPHPSLPAMLARGLFNSYEIFNSAGQTASFLNHSPLFNHILGVSKQRKLCPSEASNEARRQ